jgi:hypothetical protein
MIGESQRSIYRTSALEHHQHKYKKDVLPRLVSPPFFLLLWILLGLLLTAMALLLPELGKVMGG